MKIVHISATDSGGAGLAAKRLHKGLLEIGIDSNLLVFKKVDNSTDKIYQGLTVVKSSIYQKILNKLGFPQTYAQKKWKQVSPLKSEFECITFADSEYDILNSELVQSADIINLHWVAGFINYHNFFSKINKPVFWTLHDMNPFTGCFHYRTDIDANPLLAKICQLDESIKIAALKKINSSVLKIISPSKWLMNESINSKVFKQFDHYCIPYGIDTRIFKIRNRQECLQYFNFPDKKILLFVSDNISIKRKGFNLLINALEDINLDDTLVVAAGRVPAVKYEKITYIGTIASELEMSYLYNIADMFIIPTIEDNLPNVILESLACGTPVMGFNVGGLPDLINEKNGVLIDEISVNALRKKIQEWIDNSYSYDKISIAKESRQKYALKKQAESYYNLYQTTYEQFKKVYFNINSKN